MKTLALDIGNVCVAIRSENLPERLGFMPPAEFYRLFTEEFEHGTLDDDEFYRKSIELFPHHIDKVHFWNAFESTVCEPLPGMEDFVRGLEEKGWRAVFFSDTSRRHLEAVKRQFPAWVHVAGAVCSYAAGASKPSEKMFAAFEKEWGVPDLYLDDRQSLIDGAKKRGWNAVLFSGAEKVILP